MSKKEKKQSNTGEAEAILKQHGFEIAKEGEPIDMPEQTYFDDDILDKNIIIKGIKKVGERETQFGVTTDYLITAELNKEKILIRTNHAYAFGVIYRLDKYKRPFKARLVKGKSGRYFLAGWID